MFKAYDFNINIHQQYSDMLQRFSNVNSCKND